jgi:polar amino acid transport system substrate-binding protein
MRIVSFLFFILIACFGAQASETKYKFTIVTEDVPPMQIVQDEKVVSGISFEIVSAIFKQANLSPDFHVLPWARAYRQALNEPNTFIISLVRNAEREDNFIWLSKLFTLKSNIMTLKSRKDLSLSDTSNLLNYSISVTRGDYGDLYLKSIGLKENENLYLTVKHEHKWKMLFNGRVDAVFSNDLTAKTEIISSGLAPELVHSIYNIEDVPSDLYLAANKQTDPQLIELLNKSYNEIKRSGELDEIILKWSSKVKLSN